jgi:hypothetical protein
MNSSSQSWQRLVAAARRAPLNARAPEAPFGFATRVAAQGLAQHEGAFGVGFTRLSWRALGVAGLLMIVSMTANFSSALSAFQPTEATNPSSTADAATEWLELI